MNRITALTVAGALVAAPLATVLAASPASADTTKRGACGQGSYEFQVDREDREDGPDDDVEAVFAQARRSVEIEVFCNRGEPTVAEIERNELPED